MIYGFPLEMVNVRQTAAIRWAGSEDLQRATRLQTYVKNKVASTRARKHHSTPRSSSQTLTRAAMQTHVACGVLNGFQYVI